MISFENNSFLSFVACVFIMIDHDGVLFRNIKIATRKVAKILKFEISLTILGWYT